MTGNLQIKTTANGKQYFYMVLNFHDKHLGKRRQKWISTGLEVKGNKREAEKMLRIELAKYDDCNVYNYNADMLFSDWIEYWLKSIQPDVEKTTYEGYLLHSKHAIVYFKNSKLKLKDLKVRHFEEYYHEMLTHGKVNQKTKESSGLAVRTVRSHKFIINAALNKAVLNEIIRSNPAQSVKVTNKSNKQLQRKIQFFTTAEANQFLEFVYTLKDVTSDLIFATLHFGLRRSEVLGLTCDSVDFQRHKLFISRTVVKITTLHDKYETKTPDSYRSYPMTLEIEDFFRNVISKKKKYEQFFGNTYHKSSFLFTWEDGHLFSPDFIYHHFSLLVKKFGRNNFTFHNLRHSTASILQEKGWQPKDIQEWLGHADFYTTMNIYTHISKYHQDERAQSLTGTLMLPSQGVRTNVRTDPNPCNSEVKYIS